MARLNDVHAFGYNSAGSERIWMKFGEFRVRCLELVLTDFGRDPRRSESEPILVFFCPVHNTRLTNFRSAKVHEICTQDVYLRGGESFRNEISKIFPQGVVFPKTQVF